VVRGAIRVSVASFGPRDGGGKPSIGLHKTESGAVMRALNTHRTVLAARPPGHEQGGYGRRCAHVR